MVAAQLPQTGSQTVLLIQTGNSLNLWVVKGVEKGGDGPTMGRLPEIH